MRYADPKRGEIYAVKWTKHGDHFSVGEKNSIGNNGGLPDGFHTEIDRLTAQMRETGPQFDVSGSAQLTAEPSLT